jgi:hypothetical protein
MAIELDTHFVRKTPFDPASAWEVSALTDLATRTVPEAFFREQKTLLVADQTRLWLRWFLEGFASPLLFVDDASKTSLHVFEVALRGIDSLYPHADPIQRRALANAVTEHLFADVLRHRSKKRDHATQEKRRELLEAATPPRCYLCGYAFSQEAQDSFLKVKGRNPIQLPAIVDVLRPRGLILRDLSIEIEHVVPVASGGSGPDNFRLACGWCNRFKGAKTSLYDAAFSSSRGGAFRIGAKQLLELPEPFWTIRLLAINSRCQHVSGCTATSRQEEMFVALRDWEGSPNPTNLRFYCTAHDPIASDRYVASNDARRIWGKS